MIGTQAASTVLTFPSEGPATVTCTIADPTSEEGTTSVIINFLSLTLSNYVRLWN